MLDQALIKLLKKLVKLEIVLRTVKDPEIISTQVKKDKLYSQLQDLLLHNKIKVELKKK